MNAPTKLSRRAFVAGTGMGLAGLQVGCRSLICPKGPPPYYIDKRHDDFFVDSHGHIFNGADIPIRGFLFQTLLEHYPSAPKWWVPIVKILLEGVIVLIQREQSDPQKEINFLNRLLAEQAIEEARLNPRGDAHISRAILDDLLAKKYEENDEQCTELFRAELEKNGEITKLLKPFTKGAKQFSKAVGLRYDPTDIMQTLSLSPELEGAFTFIKRLMKFRVYNMFEWVRTYPQVDLFLPSFLDPEMWIDDSVGVVDKVGNKEDQKVSIEKQMETYGLITRLFRGRVLPFIGFDPLRSLLTNESLGLVETALTDHGFAGIKMYPTMGFRLWNNQQLSDDKFPKTSSRHPRPTHIGQGLDTQLEAVYELCLEKGAAVLTHCENSLASDLGFEVRAHPKFFHDLWAKDAKFKQVRINMGHWGGMSDVGNKEDTTGTDERGWARFVANNMMIPGTHTYADVGDYHGVRFEERRNTFYKTLGEVIERYPGSLILDRLMYGSDWYMLAKEPNSEFYLNHWHQIHRRIYRDNVSQFFGKNALNWLGLSDHSSEAFTRLNKFFQGHGIKPNWPSA